MGQAQSGDGTRHVTTEQLSRELVSCPRGLTGLGCLQDTNIRWQARKFSKRCFTPIELYSFHDVFRSLADNEGSIVYLKENTLAQFLEIPDIIGASSILFHMVSYLGAFPFGQDAPVVLGFEQMIMVVVIMTERYQRVLKKGNKDRTRLFFRSLAIYDRHEAESHNHAKHEDKDSHTDGNQADATVLRSHAAGFAIDDAANDDEDEDDDDDDELALAALEDLDAIEVFKHGDAPIGHSTIPSDNLRKLIMLLLLIAPLDAQEGLAMYVDRVTGDNLEGLRRTADSILSSFVNVESSPGVKLHHFNSVIPISLPFLFNGLNPLFEHFLFSKNIDFTKRKDNTAATHQQAMIPHETDQPLLSDEGEIMDLNVLSQLSFFIRGSSLFRRLRLLYSGGDAGFSMGSFETRVFNWRAPTILLVSGNRISEPPNGGQERAFVETLPPKRFRNSSNSSHVVYGVYCSQPWRQTYKECVGDADTLLFQLEPIHEVFHASSINTDYVSFTKPPTSHAGIGIGSPHPKAKATAGLSSHVSLGAVSLMIDASFEFGVFTHNYTSGGGAFHNSISRRYDWQDRFEIESLEVWGCGGDEEAEQQRQRWAWEEREAEARRKVNLGTGDIEADRALLEMAGLIGGNRSGGSMR